MINAAYELRLTRMRENGIDTSKFDNLLKQLKEEWKELVKLENAK